MASVSTSSTDHSPQSGGRGTQGFSVPQGSGALAQNFKPLMIGVVVIVATAAVGTLLLNNKQKNDEQARSALYLARKAVDGELRTIAKAELPPSIATQAPAKPAAPAGKGEAKDAKKDAAAERAEKQAQEERELAGAMDKLAYRKLDVDAKFPEGVKKLKAVTEEHKGTRAAYDASIALGNLYADHGDPAKAVTWFDKAAGEAPGKLERSLAFAAVGYANENLNKLPEAAQNFEKALKDAEGAVKADVLLSLGRVQERLSDPAKAKATYDQVISQYPNSDYAKTAELQKSQLP